MSTIVSTSCSPFFPANETSSLVTCAFLSILPVSFPFVSAKLTLASTEECIAPFLEILVNLSIVFLSLFSNLSNFLQVSLSGISSLDSECDAFSIPVAINSSSLTILPFELYVFRNALSFTV